MRPAAPTVGVRWPRLHPSAAALIFSLVDLVVYSSAYLFHALAVREFPLEEALTTASYAMLGRLRYFGWPLQLFAIWVIYRYTPMRTNIAAVLVSIAVFAVVGFVTLGVLPARLFYPSLSAWNLPEGFAMLCGVAASAVWLHLLRRKGHAT